jgi:threonine dehydratase
VSRSPIIAGPRPTTFIEAPNLTARLGANVVIASEAFQWTGSFKFRAAHYVATHVPHAAMVTASSGNFGAALALICRVLGKQCTVVMPAQASRLKMDTVRSFGATVDLCDTTRRTRESRVAELAQEQPGAYIASSNDDPLVIAGNASLGRELARWPFDAILVPIGGGGLAAGVVSGLRNAGASTPVWAIEPALANDFSRSFAAGRIIAFDSEPETIADGARLRRVGQAPWAVLQHGVAGVLEVSEDAIRDGVRLLFSQANLKAEPTGALTVAALLDHPDRFRDARICCVVSGGNVHPHLYAEIVRDA